jgi:hypothetical protein
MVFWQAVNSASTDFEVALRLTDGSKVVVKVQKQF